jgi:uncharacterized membrane protein
MEVHVLSGSYPQLHMSAIVPLLTVIQIYLCSLKYTPYFVFAFILIYGLIDVHYVEPEFSLTMAIIPATLLHLALAVYFVRHEIRIGMISVLVSLVSLVSVSD